MNRPYEDSKRRLSRHSIRLQDYDYSQAGAYFVTTCTLDRVCLFGEIVNGQMRLNEHGTIAQSTWENLTQFYETIHLDSFVIMPNHVHGVIIMNRSVGAIYESPVMPVRMEDRRNMLLFQVSWTVQNDFGQIDQRFATNTGETSMATQLLRTHRA